MDISKVALTFLIWIIIIKVLTITLKRCDIASIRGAIGEKRVNKKIKKIKGHRLLHDIMINGKNGTTQIDHILIGPKGIFVIETKNYSGWIFGSEESKYWTQTLGKKKYKFFNPIRQNKGHIKAISNYIPSYSEMLKSIIVFNDKVIFKKLDVTSSVMHIRDIKKYISRFKGEVVLEEKDINEIYNKLLSSNITNAEIRRAHNIELKAKYQC